MAILVNTTFRGVPLSQGYVKISHIFGGTAGWSSVVELYASPEAAGRNADGTVNPEFTKTQPLDTYNQTAAYVADANPFELLYAELKQKYPGAVDCQPVS